MTTLIDKKKNLEEILAEIASFVEENIYPLEATFLQDGFGAVLPQLKELRKDVKAKGLFLG